MAKCYGMIPRQPAYQVLEALGRPKRILGAWRSYLEGLRYYNTIGQAAGELHSKSRSLPQGDSWSTRALAAILGIWARRIQKIQARPRYLADDMFVRCEAEGQNGEAEGGWFVHVGAGVEGDGVGKGRGTPPGLASAGAD